jgi:hypothetical protein
MSVQDAGGPLRNREEGEAALTARDDFDASGSGGVG